MRVERDSQKGIVIGKGGAVLRDAGTRGLGVSWKRCSGTRVDLDIRVQVDADWQRRAGALDWLGL